MNDSGGVSREMFAMKRHGGGIPRHAVRLQLVAALLFRDQNHTQIAIDTVPSIEESVDKIDRRRKLAVARWAVYRQRAIAIFKPGREDQRRKIDAMVNVEMREQNHIELGHFRATLCESKSATTAGVD